MAKLARPQRLDRQVLQCRRVFLHHFPGGYRDETYEAWERDYKVAACDRWVASLDKARLEQLIDNGEYTEIAQTAVKIESRTNLLFSFEKMALRDAVKSPAGAKLFATGIYDFIHGKGSVEQRFERWVDVVGQLPRKQTRVLTWPVVTVFGMIAAPEHHMFLKPMVTRVAAQAYGFPFEYRSRPNWQSYESLLDFADRVRRDTRDLKPRDMIDLQSFIWVLGSDEYA